MFCNKCGKEYDDSHSFCLHCGADNPYIDQSETQATQSTEVPPTLEQTPYQPQAQGRILLARFMPGLVFVTAAIILVVFGLIISASTPSTSTSSTSSKIAAATARYETNNVSADSAPQQQVSNGWYTNDLLLVLNNELRDGIRDEIRESNNKLVLTIWVSAALLLAALGGYFILSKVLHNHSLGAIPDKRIYK